MKRKLTLLCILFCCSFMLNAQDDNSTQLIRKFNVDLSSPLWLSPFLDQGLGYTFALDHLINGLGFRVSYNANNLDLDQDYILENAKSNIADFPSVRLLQKTNADITSISSIEVGIAFEKPINSNSKILLSGYLTGGPAFFWFDEVETKYLANNGKVITLRSIEEISECFKGSIGFEALFPIVKRIHVKTGFDYGFAKLKQERIIHQGKYNFSYPPIAIESLNYSSLNLKIGVVIRGKTKRIL